MLLHLATRTSSDKFDYYSPNNTDWGLDTAVPGDAVDISTNTTNTRGSLYQRTKCEVVEPKSVFLYVHVFKVLYP